MKGKQKRIEKAIKFYLSQGINIIPLKGKAYANNEKESKSPLIPWSRFQREKVTEQEALNWLKKWPLMDIAIVTGQVSGIVVVDFDSEEALQIAKKEGLLHTAIVKTGKGYHAYFKYPEDKKNNISNAVRINGMEIDIRGDGGYVVAPPSIHWNGTEYKWVKGKEIWKTPLAELPGKLLPKTDSNKSHNRLKPLYSGVPEGQRNSSLARLVGSWIYDGLTFEECLQMAHTWNQNNKPPLPEKEVESVVHSIWKKHTEQRKVTCPETQNILKYERNILYLPLFVYDKKLIHQPGNIIYERKEDNIERRWEVHSAPGFGLPGPFDESVFLAVCVLIEKNNLPPRNPFPIGSIKEIARTMQIKPEGKNIKLIKKSLSRLVSLTLVSDNIFYDSQKRHKITDVFHLWDRVIFRGEMIDDKEVADTTLIWMNSVILNNLRANYLMPLEYNKYIALKVPIARGIYRLISFALEKEKKVVVRYSDIQKRLYLNEETQFSKIRQQLQRGHEELKQKKIVKDIKIKVAKDRRSNSKEVFIEYIA